MRSVFSAGLLDGFLMRQFDPFDLYIGVSGGACNLAAFLAGTPGKSVQFFDDYALRDSFISYRRFFRGGHLMDLDWIFETVLTESHLKPDAVYRNGKQLIVCVTDVHTGAAVYLDTVASNLTGALKASSAMPLVYRGFPEVDGRAMSDGGVADGIPVREAIARGATRIMVVRSRSRDYVKKDTLGHRFIRWKLRHYPRLTATMRGRVRQYDDVIRLIRSPPPGVQILEVCPPEEFQLGRFGRARERLREGYESGLETAQGVIEQWVELRALS